jgi:hypothetical protein
MKIRVKPCGEPLCVRPKGGWIWAWTLADCIQHFGWVPRLFHMLDPTSTVAAVWHHLVLEWRRKLDDEFTYYDLRSGRA